MRLNSPTQSAKCVGDDDDDVADADGDDGDAGGGAID